MAHMRYCSICSDEVFDIEDNFCYNCNSVVTTPNVYPKPKLAKDTDASSRVDKEDKRQRGND